MHNRDWHERLNLPLQRRSQASLNTQTMRQYYWESSLETQLKHIKARWHQPLMEGSTGVGISPSINIVHQNINQATIIQ